MIVVVGLELIDGDAFGLTNWVPPIWCLVVVAVDVVAAVTALLLLLLNCVAVAVAVGVGCCG